MKPFRELMKIEDAKKLLLDNVTPIEDIEKVSILDAVNRVVAKDIISKEDVPPFRRAAMDGYAVIASDTFSATQFQPVELKVIDVVHAGQYSQKTVTSGSCIRIATGAPVPEAADAVVMVEDTDGDTKYEIRNTKYEIRNTKYEIRNTKYEIRDTKYEIVKIYKPVHPNANITQKGSDIKKGNKIIEKNSLLNPAKIGVLAACGLTDIFVYRLPIVGVIPTGNEIQEPGEKLEKGKIYDVNTFTLSALIKTVGAIPRIYKKAEDTFESLTEKIKIAINNCDIVILSGGSSVGEYDFLEKVLAKLGSVLFHGIAVKPGKPTIAAKIDKKKNGNVHSSIIILGMPGYPVSCLTNAYGLLTDILQKMMFRGFYEYPTVKLPMARRTTSSIGRHLFLPVKIINGEVHSSFKESGAITSLAEADGFIEIPGNVESVEKGELVTVKLFATRRI